MAQEDSQGRQTEGLGGLGEFLFLEGENLGARDARKGEPAEGADRDQERDDVRHPPDVFDGGVLLDFEDLDEPIGSLVSVAGKELLEENDENEEGNGVEDIHDSHHEGINPASGIACDGTIEDADAERHRSGHQADHQGKLSAVENAGKEIAPHLVGAQQVPVVHLDQLFGIVLIGDHDDGLRSGGSELVGEILVVGPLAEPRHDEAEDQHRDQEDPAGDGNLVLAQTVPGIEPER